MHQNTEKLASSLQYLHKQDSSTCLDFYNIFQKYKLGLAHSFAPFRLIQSNCNTSCDDISDIENVSGEQCDKKTRGPYRKYSIQQKMQAVQRIAAGQDVKIISKQYGIPRRNLLRWKKNGCQRKQGGGRPTDCQMEQLIYDKIKNKQLTNQKQIRKYAVSYSKLNAFKASKGWFIKFCQRFNIKMLQEDQSKINVIY